MNTPRLEKPSNPPRRHRLHQHGKIPHKRPRHIPNRREKDEFDMAQLERHGWELGELVLKRGCVCFYRGVKPHEDLGCERVVGEGAEGVEGDGPVVYDGNCAEDSGLEMWCFWGVSFLEGAALEVLPRLTGVLQRVPELAEFGTGGVNDGAVGDAELESGEYSGDKDSSE